MAGRFCLQNPPWHDDIPADRLRRQLSELRFPIDGATRTEVQRCVCDYVDSLKAQGWPPERVLIGLKTIAEESGLRWNALHARDSLASRSDLLMDMVGWGIARYYEPVERKS